MRRAPWGRPAPAGCHGPLKVGDVLVVRLAADVNDLREQLVAVGGALGLVHMGHELLDNLHQVLLGHLWEVLVRAAGRCWVDWALPGQPGGHAPCRIAGQGPAAGWTRPCHPDTAGPGPCGPARTWGESSESWTWPAGPGTSLQRRQDAVNPTAAQTDSGTVLQPRRPGGPVDGPRLSRVTL